MTGSYKIPWTIRMNYSFVNVNRWILNLGTKVLCQHLTHWSSKKMMLLCMTQMHAYYWCVRSHGETFTYRHNDLASMENWSVLPNSAEVTGGGILLLLKVFRMRGSNWKRLIAKIQLRLLVDDTGFGTLVARNRSWSRWGTRSSRWYWCLFSTLQNQWLTLVLFAADKDVIDYLKYNLRSQMFKIITDDPSYWLIETFRVVAK
jgi:glycine C-acetyltransferase